MTGRDPAAGAAIDVAVGVVSRADGSVLLGQRVAGKPYAGWWEFPGGKVEPGETIAQALARELDEELGLEVPASFPWVVREFSYPHARVRLHFRRVFDYAGEPRAREGQAFAWVRSDTRVECAPLLPATVPVFGWLRLAPLCVEFPGADTDPSALRQALQMRATVLLDAPGMDPDRFAALFYRTRALARAARCPVLVGDAHPASFARAADGVGLAARSLRAGARRPEATMVAARCETAADLVHAAGIGADFAIVSGALARECASSTGLALFIGEPGIAVGGEGLAPGGNGAATLGDGRPPKSAATAGSVAAARLIDAARRGGAHGVVLSPACRQPGGAQLRSSAAGDSTCSGASPVGAPATT
ncbi:MAG: NUDIX domain-containing protein [Burkholderiaceae bacterium]|nr:NUDIX domain-containing protein [Burkholderiaceae bacterium]